jgi:hypothetical protein
MVKSTNQGNISWENGIERDWTWNYGNRLVN